MPVAAELFDGLGLKSMTESVESRFSQIQRLVPEVIVGAEARSTDATDGVVFH